MNERTGFSSSTPHSPLEAIQSAAKSALFNDFNQFDGLKAIVWDAAVMKHVDLLIPFTEFTAHNVKSHFVLPERPADDLARLPMDGVRHVFYVIPPLKKSLLKVVECLAVKLPNRPVAHVRVLTRIPKHLQELFLDDPRQPQPSLESWPFFWLPAFGDFVLNNFASPTTGRLLISDDFELFFLCAAALNDVFAARRVYWRGDWAQQVVQNLRTLKPSAQPLNCVFDSLVVVDRTLDPVSPLLEQFSVGGVLDAMFGISVKGTVEVPEDVLRQLEPMTKSTDGKVEKIALNSEIYGQIVHSAIGDAVSIVRKHLRELAEIENAHGQLTSINDFKQYMPALQMLVKSKAVASQAFRLCSICFTYCAQPEQRRQMEVERQILGGNFNSSTAVDFVEELTIGGETEADAWRALRLIALQSLVNGGLTTKLWNEYQKLLVQSFGPPAVAWCLNLQSSGLVQVLGGTIGRFTHIAGDLKKLKTTVDNDQDSLAAFFNGYVPLIVRLLDRGIRDGWKGFESFVNKQLKPTMSTAPTASRIRSTGVSNPKSAALFVIGGLTRAEIACLRSQPNGFDAIFTTGILKSHELVDFRSSA